MTRVKLLFPTLVILFSFHPCLSGPTELASVILQVQLTSPLVTDSVFISGNLNQLGNWYPDSVFLFQTSDHVWKREFMFPIGIRLEFKFTRGSWQKEAIYDTNYAIPDNHVLLVQQDTVFSIQIPAWKDNPKWSTATGDIRTHHDISGFDLKARDLNVWLPPDYKSAPERRYPVLYMHDGQNIFDQQKSTFSSEWRLDETADSLISLNRIEPLIIVAIDNTPDRGHEYLDSDTGRVYMKLVKDIIKPLIDRTYRTKPGREFTATGGSSAGGLIAFMLVWEYPEIFSKAACLSPAFKINRIDYVKNVMKSPVDQFSRLIYIDNGGVGLEARLLPGIYEMISALEQRGFTKDIDYNWYFSEHAVHNEKEWAMRTWRFLQFLFPKYNPGRSY